MSDTPPLAAHARLLAELVAGSLCTTRAGESLTGEMGMARAVALLAAARERGGSVYLIGNGGSAAVAGHIANDLLNRCGVRTATLHDAPLLTCMCNDYGYEHAYSRMLAVLVRPGDILVPISSSGRSPNMVNAARAMNALGGQVITFTGFGADNPLRALGELNFWVDSSDYGLVEVAHLFMLHHLADCLRVSCVVE